MAHVKKPLNAFMLYMKEMRPKIAAECTLKESAAINQILGKRVRGFPFFSGLVFMGFSLCFGVLLFCLAVRGIKQIVRSMLHAFFLIFRSNFSFFFMLKWVKNRSIYTWMRILLYLRINFNQSLTASITIFTVT